MFLYEADKCIMYLRSQILYIYTYKKGAKTNYTFVLKSMFEKHCFKRKLLDVDDFRRKTAVLL